MRKLKPIDGGYNVVNCKYRTVNCGYKSIDDEYKVVNRSYRTTYCKFHPGLKILRCTQDDSKGEEILLRMMDADPEDSGQHDDRARLSGQN
jgi:hypothetical protein